MRRPHRLEENVKGVLWLFRSRCRTPSEQKSRCEAYSGTHVSCRLVHRALYHNSRAHYSKNEVVEEELPAPSEELCQRRPPLTRLKSILLVDPKAQLLLPTRRRRR